MQCETNKMILTSPRKWIWIVAVQTYSLLGYEYPEIEKALMRIPWIRHTWD